MHRVLRSLAPLFLAASVLLVAPDGAAAQGRGSGKSAAPAAMTDTLPSAVKARIRDWYAAHPPSGYKPLPPGIRKNLARGKPLPPGIAKKTAPEELRALVPVRDGYQIVEAGTDVLLVEVATNVIHDVLRDIVR